MRQEEKHMEERMLDVIVEIYNHMDDSDKDGFTLEDAEDMVEDQIRMDKESGREPLAYASGSRPDSLSILIWSSTISSASSSVKPSLSLSSMWL